MDSDSWIRGSSGYRRCKSRSDAYCGEEYKGEGELRAEFLCPFCAQEFDMVGLCCHIDEEHAIEAKNGVCPLCSEKVASDLVCHMTMQHGSLLKIHRKRRLRRGLSNLSFSSLRKDLREGKLQSLLGGSSSFVVPTSNSEPDRLLNSFICNPTVADKFPSVQALSSVEASPMEESIVETLADRVVEQPLLSKDQKEKTRKCKFVQGLLLSAFLDDNLS